MDLLHMAIAVVPLAIYLAGMGMIHVVRRPTLVSGVWDALWLAAALSGWFLIGPIELFLPDTAIARFGVWVWVPLVCLYGLLVLLAVLVMRPRLIVYNVTGEQLRPLLAQTVTEMDDRARWAGDCLTLPQQRIQLHFDSQPGIRQVQLVAVGTQQDLEAWRRLSRALVPRLKELHVPLNVRGASYLLVGSALLIGFAITWATRPQEFTAAIRDLLLR